VTSFDGPGRQNPPHSPARLAESVHSGTRATPRALLTTSSGGRYLCMPQSQTDSIGPRELIALFPQGLPSEFTRLGSLSSWNGHNPVVTR
jgi:hypothetical protein